MFQLLPALILLLLQSQGHGNQFLIDGGSEKFLRAVYSQELKDPDLDLVEHLRGWIEAIEASAPKKSVDFSETSVSTLKAREVWDPVVCRYPADLTSSQRMRDGPHSIA